MATSPFKASLRCSLQWQPFSTGNKYRLSEAVGKRGDLEAPTCLPHLPLGCLVCKMGSTQKDTHMVLSAWDMVSTSKMWKVYSVWEEDQCHPLTATEGGQSSN